MLAILQLYQVLFLKIICGANADTPEHNASKSYTSNYMEGLRLKALALLLQVCTPDMWTLLGQQARVAVYWRVESPEKTALQIFDITQKCSVDSDVLKTEKADYSRRLFLFRLFLYGWLFE